MPYQQNYHQQLGAHEVMEAHEVLTGIISGINNFELLRPHVTDQQLTQIMDRQLNYASQTYNNLVAYLSNTRGVKTQTYNIPARQTAKYGLRNPAPVAPSQSENAIGDREVATIMLGIHKAGAITEMTAALECADPQLRAMLLQGAVACAEKAFETFQYMNAKGYYQVPTLAQETQGTMLNTYQPLENPPQGVQFTAGAEAANVPNPGWQSH